VSRVEPQRELALAREIDGLAQDPQRLLRRVEAGRVLGSSRKSTEKA
jgi:hypothetical protein